MPLDGMQNAWSSQCRCPGLQIASYEAAIQQISSGQNDAARAKLQALLADPIIGHVIDEHAASKGMCQSCTS